ncbi:hypothetical protein GOV09_05050 [Candidatus Woesearchaeota archaeon]|nr:hypothetical protein [Candidatus Woesearchaeota archaeon]
MADVPLLKISPSPLTAQMMDVCIGENVDAILLNAYASGTVGSAVIEPIYRATHKGIPVFSFRDSQDDRWIPEWSNRPSLPGVYEAEATAIEKGLIPLRVDHVRFQEMYGELLEICDTHTTYETKTRAAMERFSPPEWNERIEALRKVG